MNLHPTAILIPSLNRPQRLRTTVENIHAMTPEQHFLLFAVSDPESKEILDELGEWYIDDSLADDHRYVTRMNELIGYLDDAETMFFGSDDVVHHAGWLSWALSAMTPDKRVVVVNDMHNMAGTQAVVHRSYLQNAVFDAPGLAFHPGYRHNFADNEMFFTARCQGEFVRSRESIVEHLHPIHRSINSIEWDPTYQSALAGWDEDEKLWRMRREQIAAHFGG